MRLYNGIGLLAALMMLLSSGAHGLLGWPAIHAALDAASAPPELVLGIRVGWIFGAACMLVFGAQLLLLFLRRWRGQEADTTPALLIGIGYLGFGLWALATDFQPFYFVFVVPAVLVLIAALGRVRA